MADMVCGELTTAPIWHPPVVGKMWSEIEPGKNFAFSYSDLIGNKLVNFTELNLF